MRFAKELFGSSHHIRIRSLGCGPGACKLSGLSEPFAALSPPHCQGTILPHRSHGIPSQLYTGGELHHQCLDRWPPAVLGLRAPSRTINDRGAAATTAAAGSRYAASCADQLLVSILMSILVDRFNTHFGLVSCLVHCEECCVANREVLVLTCEGERKQKTLARLFIGIYRVRHCPNCHPGHDLGLTCVHFSLSVVRAWLHPGCIVATLIDTRLATTKNDSSFAIAGYVKQGVEKRGP